MASSGSSLSEFSQRGSKYFEVMFWKVPNKLRNDIPWISPFIKQSSTREESTSPINSFAC